MVQKGYLLLSGILILGIFMFISTIYTLENYNTNNLSAGSSSSRYFSTFSYQSNNSSSSSSSPSLTTSSLKYFPIPFFHNETLWNLNQKFDQLLNKSSSSLTSMENYFHEKFSGISNINTTTSENPSTSYLQLPSLSYVQNQTFNLWNNMNNQLKHLKLFQYTTWNLTESSNSSLFESELVQLFASKANLENSRTNNLRGVSEEEEEAEEEEEEKEKEGRKEEVALLTSTETPAALIVTQAPLHPAVPDPEDPLEIEISSATPSLTTSPCKNTTFEPTCDMYPYVRFWKKTLNSHDCHRSPLYRRGVDNVSPLAERYVVFQPDLGGWNNIRMAAETAMLFAFASGRTLVLPPKLNFYLLDKNDHGFNRYLFDSFFDLRKVSELVDMISMDEFLQILAMEELKLLTPQQLNGMSLQEFSQGGKHLWNYLEKTCYLRDYHPGRVFFGFNLSHDTQNRFGPIQSDERLKKHAAHKRDVIVYDENLDSKFCIYFPGDYRDEYRILTHFYSYLYWADPHEERIYKRLVRDRLHYIDPIFCGAGRAVKVLHEESQLLMPTNPSSSFCKKRSSMVKYPGSTSTSPPISTCQDQITLGGDVNVGSTYHALHIRRGDFQYKHTRLTAEQIWKNIKHLLNTSVTRLLYIATDEKDKSFFAPFHENFEVRFFEDIATKASLIKGKFDQNHVGMAEQIICANAHTFIGTPLSTFTGYITRMRGYYRDGRYSNTFYTMPDAMYQLQLHPELVGPFWAREFAVAHRDIDDDYNLDGNESVLKRQRRRTRRMRI